MNIHCAYPLFVQGPHRRDTTYTKDALQQNEHLFHSLGEHISLWLVPPYLGQEVLYLSELIIW